MYVYYGTNEYNFEKLENPPAYEPTRCSQCGGIIVLSQDGYSIKEGRYWCEECTDRKMRKRVR
jgi:formylmethanofuran dehydrogenase subunit E